MEKWLSSAATSSCKPRFEINVVRLLTMATHLPALPTRACLTHSHLTRGGEGGRRRGSRRARRWNGCRRARGDADSLIGAARPLSLQAKLKPIAAAAGRRIVGVAGRPRRVLDLGDAVGEVELAPRLTCGLAVRPRPQDREADRGQLAPDEHLDAPQVSSLLVGPRSGGSG
jgi:hypothetical protein